MALTVVHGPLPNDGQSVVPDTFLEAWIAGSEIYGLGLAAFVDTPLNSRAFVVASTEPPSAQDRIPGLLWFKRGEGRLYRFDRIDSPSSLTFTSAEWLSISDRRDIYARTAHAIQTGWLCQFFVSPSETEMLGTMTEQGAFAKYGGRFIYAMATPGSGVTGKLQGELFVALASTVSGGLIPFADLGFCQIVTGSGDTGAAGSYCVREAASLAFFGFTETPTQATSLGRVLIGYSTESTATNTAAPFLRNVFKFATLPWIPSGTP